MQRRGTSLHQISGHDHLAFKGSTAPWPPYSAGQAGELERGLRDASTGLCASAGGPSVLSESAQYVTVHVESHFEVLLYQDTVCMFAPSDDISSMSTKLSFHKRYWGADNLVEEKSMHLALSGSTSSDAHCGSQRRRCKTRWAGALGRRWSASRSLVAR